MAQHRPTANRTTRPTYRTNGAAAYDINRIDEMQYGNAARELQRPKRKPRTHPKVKAKQLVAPLSIVGMMAAVCMLVFVICGYVQLFEESTRLSDLRQQLSDAQEQNARLQATYDSKIDLDVIQEKAAALGMTIPNSKQTIYLSLPGSDKAVISDRAQESIFVTGWNAISRSVHTLLEYFR